MERRKDGGRVCWFARDSAEEHTFWQLSAGREAGTVPTTTRLCTCQEPLSGSAATALFLVGKAHRASDTHLLVLHNLLL